MATRNGLMLGLALEGLVLLVVPPRTLKDAPAALTMGTFWALASAFYLSNYRVWRWLQRSQRQRNSN